MTQTLDQIREQHKKHIGFIWECPYCKDAWQQAQIEQWTKEQQEKQQKVQS